MKMKLWEKIYWTVAVVCFMLIIAFAIAGLEEHLIFWIPLAIFAFQLIVFVLYLMICKIILGCIWGLDIQLFTLPKFFED